MVLDIMQDKQGFLWFATEQGLNRYDGYTFTVYNPEPDNPKSIGGTAILDVYEDHDGIIWIGTRNNGLDKFDPDTETFTHYPHNADDPNSLSKNLIRNDCIFVDSTGIVWIGAYGG